MNSITPLPQDLQDSSLPASAKEALGEEPLLNEAEEVEDTQDERQDEIILKTPSPRILSAIESAGIVSRVLSAAATRSGIKSRRDSAKVILQKKRDKERDYVCQFHTALILAVVGVGLVLAGLGMVSYGIPTDDRLRKDFGSYVTKAELEAHAEVKYFLFARIGGLLIGLGLFFEIVLFTISYDYKLFRDREKPKKNEAEIRQKMFYANIMKELKRAKMAEEDDSSTSSRTRSASLALSPSPFDIVRNGRPSSAIVAQKQKPVQTGRRMSLPVKELRPNHLSPKWAVNDAFDFSDEAVEKLIQVNADVEKNTDYGGSKSLQLKSLDDLFQVKSPRVLGEYTSGVDKICEEPEQTQVDKDVDEILKIDKEDSVVRQRTSSATTRPKTPASAAVKCPPPAKQAAKSTESKVEVKPANRRPSTAKPAAQTRPVTAKAPPAKTENAKRPMTAKVAPPASKRPMTAKKAVVSTPVRPTTAKKPTEAVSRPGTSKTRVQTAKSLSSVESNVDSENTTDFNDKNPLIDSESRPQTAFCRDYTMVFDSESSSSDEKEDEAGSDEDRLNNLNQSSGNKVMKDKLLREDTSDDNQNPPNIIDEMTKEIYRNLEVDAAGTGSSSNFNVQVHVHVHVNSSPQRQDSGEAKKEKFLLPFEGDGAI